MKLYIDGNIGRYYVQTLCLIFFPGAGFSEREEETAESDAVRLTLHEDAQSYTAEAVMRHGGEQRSGTARELRDGIDSDERIKKRAVGRAIFEAGAELFGIRPEWGILTGVRPAKLAEQLAESARAQGLDGAREAERILTGDYLAAPEKAHLLTRSKPNGRYSKFIANRNTDNKLYLICDSCGSARPIQSIRINHYIEKTKWPRFFADSMTLYIHGLCYACHKQKENNTHIQSNNETR